MGKATKDKRAFKVQMEGHVVREAEELHKATVITFASQFDNPKGKLSPGGQCSCCGLSPHVDGVFDWWLVFKAGLVDSDGVYYSMLCDNSTNDGCLSSIRREKERREKTKRDEAAEVLSEMLGDDVDGAEAMMDDLDALGMLD